MTTEFVVFLAAGAFAGGFINGFAGFGTSLFALGWLLQVMSPIEAVAITIFLSLLSGIQGIVLIRRNIDWRALSRFLIPACFGVPVGIYLLTYLNASILTMIVAVFLIGYGGFYTFKSNLPNLTRDMPVLDVSVGFIGGILGAVSGMSGALPTVLCSMRPWPKMRQRALIQPFNFIILALSAVLLFFKSAYTDAVLKSMLVATPITLIASLLGITLFKRVSDTHFRRLLIFLMLISGIILIARR